MDSLQTKIVMPAPRSIRAGALEIAYCEYGPADGPVVFLMHGFPYDVHTYADVAQILAS
jgi:pimeloyl-ACP methyl ester carboxylesterase